MTFRYDEIGNRLKAFRLGSGLSADEIAKRIGVSRTALYRLEKGELVKLETLEKLSELLGVSVPTLLGVGIEYISSAVSYFERLRQIEERAEHIIVLAGPISFLLATDRFQDSLERVLIESIGDDVPDRERAMEDVRKVMEILRERKRTYLERMPNIVNLISAMDIERFLRNGFTGRTFLPEEVLAQRRALARAEVEHFASVIEEESMGIQIGLVTATLPHTGFQIFRQDNQKTLTISPFRLGEQPNVRVGVAMITSAPEALALHERTVREMWRTALKGAAAARYLRDLLANTAPAGGR
ncbi:helix-turn-helix domain-containing protein [Ancylobacter mangrovi]|uniref:Helix-turn-helix transcriptional regulator n=1 Tax=Ancylobacter mangrovi TaxID=2972472 RepID=A0A9X2T6N2_9HYPH|nr:helix-turn-helix transcriptional regulator [Ancylobacter mangrovi]MCS0496569.1 helix-turn-helix transcriptional regulator [Ancylobacter mangrovi]MCS0503740.1 helix-turn-helix transcriptional regulator [Ancylobacter mangrovi]